MGEIRQFSLKPTEPDEEAGCVFCHPHYGCHDKGFTTLSCPRVQSLSFFAEGEEYSDWDIQAVLFRDYHFEGELDFEGGEDDG